MTGPATITEFITAVTGLTTGVGLAPLVLASAIIGGGAYLFRRMVKGAR